MGRKGRSDSINIEELLDDEDTLEQILQVIADDSFLEVKFDELDTKEKLEYVELLGEYTMSIIDLVENIKNHPVDDKQYARIIFVEHMLRGALTGLSDIADDFDDDNE